MAIYPSTPCPDVGSTETHRLEAIRTEAEAGYGMTRRKFTKRRVVFVLNYTNITVAECDTLKTFFLTNQGSIFDYNHVTVSGTEAFKVMFASDELSITLSSGNLRDVSVSLITV